MRPSGEPLRRLARRIHDTVLRRPSGEQTVSTQESTPQEATVADDSQPPITSEPASSGADEVTQDTGQSPLSGQVSVPVSRWSWNVSRYWAALVVGLAIFSIPVAAQSGLCNLNSKFESLYNFIAVVAMGVALPNVAVGAIQFMMAGSSVERSEEGKQRVLYTFASLAIVAIAGVATSVIADLLNITGNTGCQAPDESSTESSAGAMVDPGALPQMSLGEVTEIPTLVGQAAVDAGMTVAHQTVAVAPTVVDIVTVTV